MLRYLLLLFLSLASTGAVAQRVLRVAAAADLQQVFPELKTAFAKVQPGIALEPTFGSSGNFYAQLEARAPFDLFLSADLGYPDRLLAAGLGSGPVRPYARGRLVLWARKGSPVKVEAGLAGLMASGVRRVAIANPRVAPYGRAAEAALRSAGLWEGVQARLVFGENVAQAAQYAESGAVDAGLIAHSHAASPLMRAAGTFLEVPQDRYPSLIQGGLVLSWARDPEAARTLLDFLRSRAGQGILERYGFLEVK
jgi:molybdate transport system substrate-binding protein